MLNSNEHELYLTHKCLNMPRTSVGISPFYISRINFMLSLVEHEKSFHNLPSENGIEISVKF